MSADDTTRSFRAEYYKNADFSHWLKKIDYSAKKVLSFKKDESKKGYLLDMYSSYLQLAEILLINIYANSEDGFAQRLFVGNIELRTYFIENGQRHDFIEWFLLGYDFGIKEKASINNFEQKYSEHQSILEEVISDYLKDFDFLNAYKHGYRVLGAAGNHSIAFNLGGNTSYKIAEFDTLLTYFTKENAKNERNKVIGIDVYENTILVNIKRVIIKATFLTAVLENMRLILAAEGHSDKSIVLEHFYLEDKKIWQESFGGFRSKEFKHSSRYT